MPSPFWAKKDRATGVVTLPLIAHAADVAACFEALVRLPVVAARLVAGSGLDGIPPSLAARLGVFAALHDFGKTNHAFREGRGGHIRPAVGALGLSRGAMTTAECALSDALVAALGMEVAGWGGGPDGWLSFLLAALSHHGAPVVEGEFQAGDWASKNGVDPIAGVADLMRAAGTWFPDAFAPGVTPLPTTPVFQHRFLGLLSLADWIGSDTRFFPPDPDAGGERIAFSRVAASQALLAIGLDARPAHAALAGRVPGWSSLGIDKPRPAQRAMDAADLDTLLFLIEAETGSGKTEAALRLFQRLFAAGKVDGMYFALPTRAAAAQMVGRVEAAARATFATAAPPVVTAIPGYIRVDGVIGQKGLAPFEVLWPDDMPRGRTWAAEHSKRYLAGTIAVGTVDQVLLSGLAVGHAHMRAACLSRSLLVVDEVHASDPYMRRILGDVIRRRRLEGSPTVLLSATLGSSGWATVFGGPAPSFDDAVRVPYPAVTTGGDRVGGNLVGVDPGGESLSRAIALEPLAIIDDPVAIAARAARAIRAGARVLIVRNTVSTAIETQIAVEAELGFDHPALFRLQGVPTPHHARYAPADRQALDAEVPARFGRDAAMDRAPLVLVATQTVEQSLDIDADLLITDLCPIDVLLQRLGRLSRHRERDPVRPEGFRQARAMVLTPSPGDFERWITKGGEAVGHHGFSENVYADLRILELTRRLVADALPIVLPQDNRRLVESATHPERLAALRGAAWNAHAKHVTGVETAEKNAAGFVLRRDDLPFTEVESFPTDQRVTTRLGADDRLLALPGAVAGPFGPVDQIRVPGWWDAVSADDVITRVTRTTDDHRQKGLMIEVGGVTLRYDRFGLRMSAPS